MKPAIPALCGRPANTVTTWAGPITLSADAGIEAQNGFRFHDGTVPFRQPPGRVRDGRWRTWHNQPRAERHDAQLLRLHAGQHRRLPSSPAISTPSARAPADERRRFADQWLQFLLRQPRRYRCGRHGGQLQHTGTSAITVGTDNTSSTYGGTIVNGGAETLALIKTGTGTLMLSGTNTFTGGTTVENGTLILTNNEALADGSNLTAPSAPSSTLVAVLGRDSRRPAKLPERTRQFRFRNLARWRCWPEPRRQCSYDAKAV